MLQKNRFNFVDDDQLIPDLFIRIDDELDSLSQIFTDSAQPAKRPKLVAHCCCGSERMMQAVALNSIGLCVACEHEVLWKVAL